MNWHFNIQEWICMSNSSEIPRSAHLPKQISAKPIQSSQTPGLMACASDKLWLPNWFRCKSKLFFATHFLVLPTDVYRFIGFSAVCIKCLQYFWLYGQQDSSHFFSLCEQFWSFRAKNMRSPCHLGRSKFLADSPRHLQPLVAAGPWKCVNTRQVSTLDSTKKHRCRLSYQEYYCCMHCTYLSLYSIYNYTSHINLSRAYFSHTVHQYIFLSIFITRLCVDNCQAWTQSGSTLGPKVHRRDFCD